MLCWMPSAGRASQWPMPSRCFSKTRSLVTAGDHGRGVIELIDRMIATDLADIPPRR